MVIAYKPVGSIKPSNVTQNKYTPTFYEWLSLNASKYIKVVSAGVANGGISFYKVPENHTFFLTNYLLIGYGTGIGYLLQGADLGTTHVFGKIYSTDGLDHNVPMSFPHPMRIEQNEILWVESSQAGFYISCTVMGFLVHNSVLN